MSRWRCQKWKTIWPYTHYFVKLKLILFTNIRQNHGNDKLIDDGIRHPLLNYMWYLQSNDRHSLLERLKTLRLTFRQKPNWDEINVQQFSTMLADINFVFRVQDQSLDNFFVKKFAFRVFKSLQIINSYAKIDGQALLFWFIKGLDLIQMINKNFSPSHGELNTGFTEWNID